MPFRLDTRDGVHQPHQPGGSGGEPALTQVGQRAARSWIGVATVSAGTLALDLLSKRSIIEWLGRDASSHRWEIAGRLVAFEYVENAGAAFGLFAGRVWLLSLVALVVAITFVYLLREAVRQDHLPGIALGLLVGGAAGNALERVRLGHVTDFIAIGIWPKFNIADTAITVGLILVASYLLWREPEEERPTARKAAVGKEDMNNDESRHTTR